MHYIPIERENANTSRTRLQVESVDIFTLSVKSLHWAAKYLDGMYLERFAVGTQAPRTNDVTAREKVLCLSKQTAEACGMASQCGVELGSLRDVVVEEVIHHIILVYLGRSALLGLTISAPAR